MKKTINSIGAILFSTLFYKQDLGLNLFLISLIATFILFINNKETFVKKTVLITTASYLITGCAVFVYKSDLAIIANIICFFILVGSFSESKASIYVNCLNGCYTTIAGFIHRLNEQSNTNKNAAKKIKTDYLHWLKIVGIPIIVVIIFIALYRNGNPMFNDLISKIDFSFINIQWVLLSVLGYYLLNNISAPIAVQPATTLDISTKNDLLKTKEIPLKQLENEKQLGVVLMALLNLLISFFLITDVVYLIQADILKASEFSNLVHSGINALIASIILAILIILFFFRGHLNFYKNNIILKRLSYLWILLNVCLVVVIAIKNAQYILSFGLTYKRIGVNVYLLLTFIGLFTTLIKIIKIKNLWYLLRTNTQLCIAVLIISSTFNWDKSITTFNLNLAKQTDVNYLIALSNNNTGVLKAHINHPLFTQDHKNAINAKYRNYILELNNNSWQELLFDNINFKK